MKNSWIPKVGQLIQFRGNKKPYQIVEVFATKYGYTSFLVASDVSLIRLSTLNCELITEE